MARPELRIGLQQRARQEMLLAPRMLQSIEVLQLPALELSAWLRRAFEGNEALTLEEPPLPAPHAGSAALGPRRTRADSERHDEWLRNQPAPDRGLAELVREQLALLDLDPRLLAWVRFLADSLDEQGYLSASDGRLLELAREGGLDPDPALLGRAIGVLQGLEPRGIGGRDAVESLLLQLEPGEPDYDLLCRLLEDFLDELARNKLPTVARALGRTVEELEALLGRLRELDPSPARAGAGDAAGPLWPDVLVESTADGFEVRVDSAGQPAVGLDEGVRELARDRGQPAELRRYLRDRIDHARWIVEAVEQRRETLLRIALALFDRQRAFLERGPGHLAPLRMNALARELGIHVSTVSRAVAGKYAQTPWGILPLRFLFQSEGGKEGVARDDVRERVRALIEAEDRVRPLSDDDVAHALGAEGFEVARRTVAKYRKELDIPSSYRRRAWRG